MTNRISSNCSSSLCRAWELELLELTLSRMGLDTTRAESVAEAIGFLDTEAFALCLTDMRLPDGPGLRVVEHINQKGLDLPVAVITATGRSRPFWLICSTTRRPGPSGSRISVRQRANASVSRKPIASATDSARVVSRPMRDRVSSSSSSSHARQSELEQFEEIRFVIDQQDSRLAA